MLEKTAAHTHDGFFIRGLVGVGYFNAVRNFGYETLIDEERYHGYSNNYRFQIGAAIVENFILFLDFAYGESFNFHRQDMHKDGSTGEVEYWEYKGMAEADSSWLNYEFGFGFSYYLMPSNVYLSFSAITMVDQEKYPGKKACHYPMFGITGAIGKEWWVADNLGIGISIIGRYGISFTPMYQFFEDDEEAKLYDKYIGLALSVTYN